MVCSDYRIRDITAYSISDSNIGITRLGEILAFEIGGDMEKLREVIDAQRKGKEDTPVFMVGEQLLDIAAVEPLALELLLQDLTIPEMSLEHAEKKIKAWADKHKKGNCCCVSPRVAEGILREFYGIPARGESVELPRKEAKASYIDLDAFL